jgi:hypothetical protein
MYASNIVSDAAVFAPRPQRVGSGLQPGADEPAEGRRVRLIANLRDFLAAHAPVLHSTSRAH